MGSGLLSQRRGERKDEAEEGRGGPLDTGDVQGRGKQGAGARGEGKRLA